MFRVSQTQSRTPYERLLCAVLVMAWRDAHSLNAELRAAARAWLHSDGAVVACEWLGLPVERLQSRLTEGRGPGLRKSGRGLVAVDATRQPYT